jgi:hypothetical protein
VTGPARGAVLSAADIQAITSLLALIGGWLEDAGPAVGHDLRARQRIAGTGLPGEDLPGQIAWLTAMLRYRQVTGATR